MSGEDAMRVLNMIQMARDELFDDEIEKNGTPDADIIINKIKRG